MGKGNQHITFISDSANTMGMTPQLHVSCSCLTFMPPIFWPQLEHLPAVSILPLPL